MSALYQERDHTWFSVGLLYIRRTVFSTTVHQAFQLREQTVNAWRSRLTFDCKGMQLPPAFLTLCLWWVLLCLHRLLLLLQSILPPLQAGL